MKYVGLATAFACIYGVIHDQITARICLEYFTEWHPPLVDSQNPTVVALAWGIAATWWVGLLLGIPLAWAAKGRHRGPVPIRALLRPLALLAALMATSALIVGWIGFTYAPIEIARRVNYRGPHPREFLADLFAHNASYDVGFIGGAILVFWTFRQSKLYPANL